MRLLWWRISFVKFWIGLSDARIVRNFTGKYKLIHCIQIRVILIFMKYKLRTVNEAFCAKKLLFTCFSSRLKNMKFYNVIRMHSSRMRTTRSSSHLLGGSASVHAALPSPWCGPGDPPECGPGDPPQARPLNFSLACGPRDLQGMLWYCCPRPRDLQGMLRYHMQCMQGYQPPPPLVDGMTDTCKNITFASFVCGR